MWTLILALIYRSQDERNAAMPSCIYPFRFIAEISAISAGENGSRKILWPSLPHGDEKAILESNPTSQLGAHIEVVDLRMPL